MGEVSGEVPRVLRCKSSAARGALLTFAVCGVLLGCAGENSEENTAEVDHAAVEDGGPASAGDDGADNESPEEAEEGPEATESEPAAEATVPQRVQIPSIDLDEDQLVELEIRDDGRLQEPTGWDDVGWFASGPKPGEGGPTVIAAHVDSPSGPAVFYRVLEMEQGEEITLTDADGNEHVYRVERTADFPKDDFPTHEVFGAGLEDELRLITCTGEFDAVAERHLDNRVVFASRVS